MYKKIWEENHRSVACLSFYSTKGILINTLTGFKYGKYLITDKSAYQVEKAIDVHIAFCEKERQIPTVYVTLPYHEFQNRMFKSLVENANLVMINIDFPEFKDIPSLKICDTKKYSVGSPIAIIGHQEEHQNLTLKSGIISANFKYKGYDYIQFDANIIQGNSGSPLIDVENNEVIGLVGYRLATINQSYHQLMKIINGNIEFLKQFEGKLNVIDIDLVQVMLANQNQIKHMAHEFYKTASFVYGYALELFGYINLLNYPESLEKKLHGAKENAGTIFPSV
jgi:hypothetical protein